MGKTFGTKGRIQAKLDRNFCVIFDGLYKKFISGRNNWD